VLRRLLRALRAPRETLRRLVGPIVPSGDIQERTVKSGIWSTLINVTDRALQLVMVVILARLLDPGDFGLLGIALLSVSVMRKFTKLGLNTALIQNEADDIDAYMDTVWVLQVARGVLIVAVGYVAAPYVAAFFGEPRVTDVFRVIALTPLLIGLRNPHVVYLRKDLEFHREFVYRVSGTVAQVVVAVGLAVLLENVWALVVGNVVGHAVRTAVSYPLSEAVPSVAFDRERARELYGYGKWITGLSVFGFLFAEGDDAFVGWFLGATALGYYQIAYQIARAPSTEVTNVISMTMLSSYSKIQDDPTALRRAYFKVLTLAVSVSAPMTVGIIVVAPDFVVLFLGPDWEPAVVLMQVLAVWGYLLSVGATSGPLLKAIGRPDYATKATVAKTLLLAVLIYPATDAYGVVGTAAAVVVSAALTSEPYIAYNVLSELDASFSAFLWRLGVPTASSLLMGAAVVGARRAVPFGTSVPLFVALVCFGAVTYAAVLLSVDRLVGYGIRDIVETIVRRGEPAEAV